MSRIGGEFPGLHAQESRSVPLRLTTQVGVFLQPGRPVTVEPVFVADEGRATDHMIDFQRPAVIRLILDSFQKKYTETRLRKRVGRRRYPRHQPDNEWVEVRQDRQRIGETWL